MSYVQAPASFIGFNFFLILLFVGFEKLILLEQIFNIARWG